MVVFVYRYDARFRSYGWDKQINLIWLATNEKCDFYVLNDAFIMEAAHKQTEESIKHKNKKSDQMLWLTDLYNIALFEIRNQIDACGYIVN